MTAPVEPSWVQSLIPFAQAFGPAIGWIVVGIGWKIVSADNDKRERRKEIRGLLKEARDLVVELERCAYEYYRKLPGESGELATRMKRESKHLAKMLTTMKKINSGLDFDSALLDFRQKLTGGDFEAAARVARSHSDSLYLEISTAALELTSAFEEKFGAIYP